MKVAVITSSNLPVPATKGGAVENLIVNLLKENEVQNKINFQIFSTYDKEAYEESKKYQKSSFTFIKSNKIIDFLDKLTFFIAKNILKKKKYQIYIFFFKRLHFLNKVSKDLHKNNYDKILLENHPTQFLALKWRKNFKKYENKYYYHCHNEFIKNYGCKNIIDKTNKFICVSKYIATTMQKHIDLDDDKFCVLRNCIDLKRFSYQLTPKEKKNLKKAYQIKNEKILLFTGRLTEEKGIIELIQSLINVKNKNYKLFIAGAPFFDTKIKTPFEEKLLQLTKKLEGKVIYTGYIKYEEINKIYALADISILPSIWNDPAPLTIIESLASGLPIITTNSGGIPEYVNKKCSIILNRDKNIVKNLTSSIDKLINSPKIIKGMSKESRNVSKDLTIENYYNNFYNIIK